MANKGLPSQGDLRQLLHYDPETGCFIWKPRPLDMFTDSRMHKVWNARWANKLAFTNVGAVGYLRGTLLGFPVYAHRVAWKMANDDEPELIDHINRDQLDNRLCNLRATTRSENFKNSNYYERLMVTCKG